MLSFHQLPSLFQLRISVEQWSRRTGSSFQVNRLSLRNNQLKFKTAGKLPIILEEFRGDFNKGKSEDVNM